MPLGNKAFLHTLHYSSRTHFITLWSQPITSGEALRRARELPVELREAERCERQR
jgi:hypothetical protein